jgi:beta-galactosidase GanA
MNEETLREHGIMFARLLESERFKELMGLYFTFIKRVNEETKEIDYQIIENPPEVVAQKMQGKVAEEQNTIQVVTGGVAQAVLEQAKKKANTGGRRYKDPKRR